MQQRYYDPQVGRFLSVDPAASEFNRYDYAADNPYRFTDPDGRHNAPCHSVVCGHPSITRADLGLPTATNLGGGGGGTSGRPSANMPPGGYLPGAAPIGSTTGPAPSAVELAGQAAAATDIGAHAGKKFANLMEDAGKGLPTTRDFVTIGKFAAGVARTAQVVSVGVDLNDVTRGETSGDRAHGAVGLVVTGISLVQPEVGVAYGVMDLMARQATYDDFAEGTHAQGWQAVGLEAVDLLFSGN